MISLSKDYVVFLEYLQNQSVDLLCQLIEEGVIFAYEDALSGDQYRSNQTNNSMNSNVNLYKFLHLGLDFIELTISKMYKEFLPSTKDNL